MAMQVRAGYGSSWREAGIYLRATSDGSADVIVSADRFVVADPNGSFSPFSVVNGVLRVQAAILGNLVVDGTLTAMQIESEAITSTYFTEFAATDPFDVDVLDWLVPGPVGASVVVANTCAGLMIEGSEDLGIYKIYIDEVLKRNEEWRYAYYASHPIVRSYKAVIGPSGFVRVRHNVRIKRGITSGSIVATVFKR